MGWELRFEDSALAARASQIETRVLVGGCDGTEVAHTARFGAHGAGEAPGELSAGVYGFAARASDEQCEWFAEGCATVTLPADEPVRVVLAATEPAVDQVCREGGIDDAGVLDGARPDTSIPDGSEPDAGADTSTGSFDPTTPKCPTEPTAALVACYDFDGTLADATGHGHDAVGSGSFESSLSGSALRPGGETIVVADDPALDLSVLTIEIWFRADDMVNLLDEQNGVNLLFDNDQQYNLGFDPDGQLQAELYSQDQGVQSLDSSDGQVQEDTWHYAALSYDGERATVYLDGAVVQQVALSIDLSVDDDDPMHIGSGSPNTTHPVDGLIDALRVWSVARSAVEICESAGRRFADGACQ